MKQVNYRFLFVFSVAFAMLLLVAQRVVLAQPDSTVREGRRIVTLKPVVVRNNLNVAAFIERVKNDSSFFKAFRNLRVIGYTSLNDIQVFDRNDKVRASLHSKTIQYREGSCRWMKVVEEKTSGDFYDDEGDFNYYTAQLYGSLFLSRDTICGENNIVKGIEFNPRGKSRMDKHKEQLKMLFFNPGKKIPGLPFIGNKIALFDDDVSALYDFVIDLVEFIN
ncbi:MAG: hypothetical protein H7Y31_17725 [Chitinophagaceae bacterium]|nr:hypothetical protein [Chitinophagaceae bacterium]